MIDGLVLIVTPRYECKNNVASIIGDHNASNNARNATSGSNSGDRGLYDSLDDGIYVGMWLCVTLFVQGMCGG